jgi:hypothetical protein
VLAQGRKKAGHLGESATLLTGAGLLNSDELGAVLESIGPDGGAGDRLAAVVALLTNQVGAPSSARGAFAGLEPAASTKVTSAFTSALHGCLREQSVNAGSPATTRSV